MLFSHLEDKFNVTKPWVFKDFVQLNIALDEENNFNANVTLISKTWLLRSKCRCRLRLQVREMKCNGEEGNIIYVEVKQFQKNTSFIIPNFDFIGYFRAEFYSIGKNVGSIIGSQEIWNACKYLHCKVPQTFKLILHC